MKTPQRVGRFVLALLALAFALPLPASTSTEDSRAESGRTLYVVGLSPFLDLQARNDAYRHIVRLLLDEIPLNSSLLLFDAYHVKTVARMDIPNIHAFQSSKTRANQFKNAILETRRFLAATNVPPVVAGLEFDQAVRLPQFLDFIGENLAGEDNSIVLIILGSPLYRDEKEPGFSMVHGYFPSDGHLLASREKSVYGLKERGERLKGVVVHLGYFGDPWTSELHQEKISRFWRLFISQQGGQPGTFSGDLPTVFNAVSQAAQAQEKNTRQDELDRSHTKVEMLRITRDVGSADWITRDNPINLAQGPPSKTVGPMKIGIRWQGDLDLDLYARPKPQAETLYFEHTRIPEGYYFKDHRSSPDREYEFIEFQQPVDVMQVEAQINFYEGACPGGPAGEIRIEFDDRIYTSRFALEAPRGNRGREGNKQDRFWTTVDVPRILKLR